MKPAIENHPWKLIESTWNADQHIMSESLFALGNGRMGQRANHEEDFSGHSLQGSYIAGVYYPDKTKVGWWKNGYPEYFAKVINSVNFIGIRVVINGEALDLAKHNVTSFRRELDMEHGVLTRTFTAAMSDGTAVTVQAQRFLSVVRDEIAAMAYDVTLDRDADIQIIPYLDFNVQNSDANWEETFWDTMKQQGEGAAGMVQSRTKKLDFIVAAAMHNTLGEFPAQASNRDGYTESVFAFRAQAQTTYSLRKYVGVVSSLNAVPEAISSTAELRAQRAADIGYDALLAEHCQAWRAKWDLADIVIGGDESAQQGIRFNIFQLLQTFTGVDPRLNIGPKGFTGEKYGGSTYWDTEAYCLPFYLASTDSEVSKNLLKYRYNQLGKAIENAEKLGFSGGAALYPMVTMNGEECHNEWEITFEEIHRNGAIAYGIYNYIRHTQDREYLTEGGLEVLIAIARFWAQRVNWSQDKSQYVMLGVTGPNEYENNVNNNYYTNFMAQWCLEYATECVQWVMTHEHGAYQVIADRVHWQDDELSTWQDIAANMYFPYSKAHGVFLQQDGFLDKELTPVAELDPAERPINQHWSWDRILRSVYIKQADTLQGMFFFEDKTDREVMRKHFDFYEPFTVHESSLSPCVHTVLACRLGYAEKAYDLYLRTARLDLDDYNREVDEGLHVTAMGGTWMSVVYGFGGMRIVEDELHFEPFLPEHWSELSFHLRWREALLHVHVDHDGVRVEHLEGPATSCYIDGALIELQS